MNVAKKPVVMRQLEHGQPKLLGMKVCCICKLYFRLSVATAMTMVKIVTRSHASIRAATHWPAFLAACGACFLVNLRFRAQFILTFRQPPLIPNCRSLTVFRAVLCVKFKGTLLCSNSV